MKKDDFIFCDICGWGDTLSQENIISKGRRFDFCIRHSKEETKTYIKMDLPSYSLEKGNPINKKDLKLKQYNFNYEAKK